MTFAEYLALDGVNFSSLKHLHVGSNPLEMSPKRYRYHKLHPSAVKQTDAMKLGSATHTAVFEPDRMPLEYAVWTGDARRGPEWTAFVAAHPKKTILTEHQYQTACDIRDAVRANPQAMKYLERGEAEKSITWTDEVTGLPCKGRLDWLSYSVPAVVDLKTTKDIGKRAFEADSARRGYHRQLAMYAAGAKACGLLVDPRVVIIAVENTPPHEVAVYLLPSETLYAGAEEVAELLATVKRCTDSGTWPGRYQTEQDLDLPAWLFADEETDDDSLNNAGFTRAFGA